MARTPYARVVVDFLVEDPVLLVFLVLGVGAGVGAFKVRGVSFGPAAALFVGLAVGALDDALSGAIGLGLLREFGLVLFTYTVGLASGPTFLTGLRRGGVQAVALTIGLVGVLAAMCAVVAEVLGLSPADRAGLFAGSTTNTPALQAATDAVEAGDPVVAYSLAYPSAVIAMLVVISLSLGRKLRLPPKLEPPPPAARAEALVNWTVHVTAGGLPTLGELQRRYDGIGFSRIEHDGIVVIASTEHLPAPGDAVVALGPSEVVERFCRDVGDRSDHHLPLDRATFDFRRILVSNRRLAGRHLADLHLQSRYGVTVSRVRRGDDDLVATGTTQLELGDRVRVVGPADRLGEVAKLFGDSERGLAQVDAFGFAIGIAGGLAVGALTIPLPGDVSLRLGAGGGTLIVGLVLGMLSRTGPVTWQIPHGANLLLRQIGILMFLAAAGLGSGTTFADALGTRAGLELFLAGVVVAFSFAVTIPIVVQLLLKRDVIVTAGMFTGIETQPAALAYANDRTAGDERVNAAYALVFPVAMITKIIVVQFLV